MDLLNFFIILYMANTIYGLPTQDDSQNKLRPWETKENETKSKLSNDKNPDKDYVDIPEDLYNAVKPITEYYFNNIKNLMSGKLEETAKPKKTKKISKDLLKAAVTPFTAYYAIHWKALQPLGSKVDFSNKKKTDPKAQHLTSYWGMVYQQCIECEATKEFGGYTCVMCCFRYGIVCCYPYENEI